MREDHPAGHRTTRDASADEAEFDPIIVKIPIDDEDLRYLLSFKGERPKLDFKSAYDDASKKDTVGVVKDIVAMANTEGGFIVLGAENDGRACGLASTQADAVDDAKIASRLSSYLGASVEIHVSHHKLDGLALVVITVPRGHQLLVFEKDGQHSKPAHAEFRAGDVFVRHSSKSERWYQEDVRRITQRIVAREREVWLRTVLPDIQKALGLTAEALRTSTALAPPQSVQALLLQDEDHFARSLNDILRRNR